MATTPPLRVCIVGAGVAGLACAKRLLALQPTAKVTLLDKGRGIGGRCATRRIRIGDAEVRLDHGAQLIHPDALKQDTPFSREVKAGLDAGALAHWPAFDNGAAVIGNPGMNALPKYLAEGLNVHTGTSVSALKRHTTDGLWEVQTGVPPPLPGVPPAQVAAGAPHGQGATFGPFDELVLALPPIQAHALLGTVHGGGDKAVSIDELQQLCRKVTMAPCIAALYVFPRALDTSKVACRGQPVDGHDNVIAWAASGRARAGSPAGDMDTWVVHASASWSQAHLEDRPVDSARALLPHLLRLLGDETAPEPVHINGQRWRFSQLQGSGADQDFGRLPSMRLSLCGDWFLGRRVEHAYASGYNLGESLASGVV